MNQMIPLGPLALPVAFLVAVLALGSGWAVGTRAARRQALQVQPQLWLLLVVGLAAARLAYVVEYAGAYAGAPLGVLDLRDGGLRPMAGFLAAAAAAVLLASWRAALTRPLALGTATAASIWLAATAGLALHDAGAVPLPQVQLEALDGSLVDLQQFKGKPVVLNLWATWCPPCVREMPVLAQAQQQHPGVHFVFLNQGESASRVNGFLAARGLAMRNVLLDANGRAGAQLGQRALPTTLFYDAQGRLADTRVGALSPATLSERLDALAPSSRGQP